MSEEIYAEIIDGSEPLEDELIDSQDERKGIPSASEYPRMHACPGYMNLKKKLPPKKRQGPTSAVAESGTRIHDALANSDKPHALKDDEEQVFELCQRQWDVLVERFFTTQGKSLGIRHEERIFLEDKISGKFDRTGIEIHEEYGLMVDFKTGRIPVPLAEHNLQLRIYAVLLAHKHPKLKRLLVAIIQPWCYKEPIVAEYDVSDIQKARAELDAVLRISADPASKRIPGEHCKYCPCKADCEEARGVPMLISQVNPTTLVTNVEIAAFLDRVALAEQVIEAVKSEAKRRITDGQEIPGWILAPGRAIEKITEPEIVYGRVTQLGMGAKTFMRAVVIQKGKLKDALKEVTGLKGKGLDEQLAEVLTNCVAVSQSAPSLKKTNPDV